MYSSFHILSDLQVANVQEVFENEILNTHGLVPSLPRLTSNGVLKQNTQN